MYDHVVCDVEIQKTIEETEGGWEATDIAKLRSRFDKKVNKDGLVIRQELGPCWIWIGAISSTGYGSVRFHKKGYSSHAIAYFLNHGRFPIPPLEIRHKCDVRACVNPNHLIEGTRQQNIQDCVERGRHGSKTSPGSLPRGGQHHHGKKTHCPAGHEYTPDNIYIINKGTSRACKKCMILRAKNHKARKKAGL